MSLCVGVRGWLVGARGEFVLGRTLVLLRLCGPVGQGVIFAVWTGVVLVGLRHAVGFGRMCLIWGHDPC